MKTLLALAALLFVAVGCQTAAKSPVTLKIGVVDPICRKSACSCVSDAAKRAYEGMNAKLARDNGVVLEMEYFEEPMILQRAINEGKLDGMIGKVTTCGRFARTAKRDFVRLADLAKPTGEANLRGVFITLKDSPVKSLGDISGHVLGLGHLEDTEKFDLPLATLKAHGVDVPKDKQVQFFDCKSAALALLEKRADVAVISDYALEYGCIVVVGKPEDFRVIGQTDDALPFTSFFVDSRKVAPETQAKLTAALLAIQGKTVLEDLFSTGWCKPMPWPETYRQP